MKLKTPGLVEAKKQFLHDLKNDPDFIDFKKRSADYGIVNAAVKTFLLHRTKLQDQKLVRKYLSRQAVAFCMLIVLAVSFSSCSHNGYGCKGKSKYITGYRPNGY